MLFIEVKKAETSLVVQRLGLCASSWGGGWRGRETGRIQFLVWGLKFHPPHTWLKKIFKVFKNGRWGIGGLERPS